MHNETNFAIAYLKLCKPTIHTSVDMKVYRGFKCEFQKRAQAHLYVTDLSELFIIRLNIFDFVNRNSVKLFLNLHVNRNLSRFGKIWTYHGCFSLG